MTDLARWQQNNEAHLAAGLGWLRARLASLAGEGRVGNPPAERVRHSDEHLRAMVVARAAMQAAEDASSEAAEMPPALAILSERLGLSRFEAQ
ncbi:MAG: hypothetical protein WBR35_25455, partial [Anaerolineae bacterium]